MEGGEVYVKKIPSMGILDIAQAIAPEARHDLIGIRPGEKLHEQMIGLEDSPFTLEYKEHYKILPAIYNWATDAKRIKNGTRVREGFVYSSDTNKDWMSVSELVSWIAKNKDLLSKI
jgi:FlaA1/EpsC-like NDP-sugar epimerase